MYPALKAFVGGEVCNNYSEIEYSTAANEESKDKF